MHKVKDYNRSRLRIGEWLKQAICKKLRAVTFQNHAGIPARL